jgi:membrane-associated phospholipid phosphatase
MHLYIVLALSISCVLLIVLERLGAPVVLDLKFRGDIKRESQWFAQYGQFVCTAVVVVIIWQMDAGHRKNAVYMAGGVAAASVSAFVLKHLFSRVRPKHENAGKFFGPSFSHANHRESFPSSHSACAMALTVGLVHLYPAAMISWWALVILTATLRYVADAHWPSDVLGGLALGYATGWGAILLMSL